MECRWSGIYRSCRSQMSFKIDVLTNFAIFTGKHQCWSLFFKNSFLYRTPLVPASEFLTKLAENNCVENHFSVELFSEISWRYFLSLSCNVSKNDSFTSFSQFCLTLNIKMEPFVKIVSSSRGVFRTESNI